MSKQPTQPHDRRNWKGQTFPYDVFRDYEEHECLYCLTDAQVDLLMGIIEPVAWDTRWESATGEAIDKQWILQFRNDIQRRLKMSCCGDDDVISRYTADGHYQTSTDGGTTWHDAPNSDPRKTYPQFPPFLPPDTVEADCTYASGIVNLMRTEIVGKLEDDMTASEILALIVGSVAAIMGALLTNPIGIAIIAIMGAVATLIVSITVPALVAALTDEVWDRLLCNLQENIGTAGEFQQSNVDAVYARVNTDETGIAAIFLSSIIAAMGTTGLTNAARAGLGNADADCDMCNATCMDNWVVGAAIYLGAPNFTFPGVEVERGDGYLIAKSTDRGDGNFNIFISNMTDTVGCVQTVTKVSGNDINAHYYVPDGSPPVYIDNYIGDETGDFWGHCKTGIQIWTLTSESFYRFEFADC